MKNHQKTLLTLFFAFISFYSWSQQSINTAGESKTTDGGEISYSIGQTFSLITNVGVQIPYEIQVISASPLLKEMGLSCEVYPNPASKRIILKMSELTNCEFQIHSADGKLLKMDFVSNETTVIPILDFNSQILFVTILTNKQILKTYKIIKK